MIDTDQMLRWADDHSTEMSPKVLWYYKDTLKQYAELRAELAAMTLDRDAQKRRADAAVADLTAVCKTGDVCASCNWYCYHSNVFPCKKFTKWCHGVSWLWRGEHDEKGE